MFRMSTEEIKISDIIKLYANSLTLYNTIAMNNILDLTKKTKSHGLKGGSGINYFMHSLLATVAHSAVQLFTRILFTVPFCS